MLGEQLISLAQLGLNDCSAFLELCLLHVLDFCAPGQLSFQHVCDQIHQRFQVVSACWEISNLIVIARKLHIEYPHFESFL